MSGEGARTVPAGAQPSEGGTMGKTQGVQVGSPPPPRLCVSISVSVSPDSSPQRQGLDGPPTASLRLRTKATWTPGRGALHCLRFPVTASLPSDQSRAANTCVRFSPRGPGPRHQVYTPAEASELHSAQPAGSGSRGRTPAQAGEQGRLGTSPSPPSSAQPPTAPARTSAPTLVHGKCRTVCAQQTLWGRDPAGAWSWPSRVGGPPWSP